MQKPIQKRDIAKLYHLPLPELMYRAATVHRKHHDHNTMQLSRLQSIKTGGCREDCKYCPQSAHYKTPITPERLWDSENITQQAKKALAAGAERFCMGAAWSSPPKQGKAYESLLECARKVKELGLEVCMTLGMLDEQQASDLKNAGVDYYNHNLDSSPEFYKTIITTRSYNDRLQTLKHVRKAGMKVCCGGIIGMGETLEDRWGLLEELAKLQPHPESVPINRFVKVPGVPLQKDDSFEPLDMVRMIATTRIVLPTSVIRLSAGRTDLSKEAQSLCILAGANSLFIGDKLLTTPNNAPASDFALLADLGLRPTTKPSSIRQAANP
ncbi:MAG: biotin synthase BioB [Proteobacteria bacterium]|nr:biotin synthase BioB [Pseudomonadota bacterium]